MTCHFPYMLKRGDNYHFRIKVPDDLRTVIGQRELTRSLKTGDRARAIPLALQLGSMARHLFQALRQQKMSTGDMRDLLRAKAEQLKLVILKEEHFDDIVDLKERHIRELREARLE